MKKETILHVSLLITIVVGVLSYHIAVPALAGSYEFNQWLGVTSSNKTWVWLMSMLVIGGCIAYIITHYYRKARKK